jgi:hypothetical protein
MRTTIRQLLVAIGLLTSCSEAFAQVPLFEVADNRTANHARRENREFLVRQLYFTKRHEFVVFNPKALYEDEIEVDFFGDEEDFKVTSRKIWNEYGESINWIGEKKGYKDKLYDLLGIKRDESSKGILRKAVADETSQLTVTSDIMQEFVDKDGNKLYRYKERYLGSDGIDRTIPENHNPRTFKVSYLYYQDILSGRKYTIVHLPNTPDVHLLVEDDRSKRFGYEDGNHAKDKRMEKKARAYDNYLRKNGFGYLVNSPEKDTIKKKYIEYTIESLKKEQNPKQRWDFYYNYYLDGASVEEVESLWSIVEAFHEGNGNETVINVKELVEGVK